MATLDAQGGLGANETGPAVAGSAPLLFDGQLLDQPTFHELYLQAPEGFRAELIDGVVYVMSSPVKPKHGRPFFRMGWFLYSYSMSTPGTLVQGDTTTKLGPRDEVQPDCSLLIEPAFGGQSGEDQQGYTTGSPELVVEIASSTLSIDLNAKKRAYERAGSLEYLVFDEPHQTFHWFALRDGKFERLEMDVDGLYRSRAFPGLWLDAAAFLRNDGPEVLASLQRGLASPEHAEFVERLRQYRANRP
jgi:Uma2 family endonuclease